MNVCSVSVYHRSFNHRYVSTYMQAVLKVSTYYENDCLLNRFEQKVDPLERMTINNFDVLSQMMLQRHFLVIFMI